MWTSDRFTCKEEEVSVSHSDSRTEKKTAIYIEDELIINMAEDIMIDDKLEFQSIICECGFINCSPGKWLSVRKSDNFVFFIPAYELLIKKKNLREYDPPYWLIKKGIFWSEYHFFNNFKRIIPDFDGIKYLRRLKAFEVASMFQQEMPSSMLDFCNECNKDQRQCFYCDSSKICQQNEIREINISKILEVSQLTIDEAVHQIKLNLLALKNGAKFKLTLLDYTDTVLQFKINNFSKAKWNGLYKSENGWGLIIGETFKVHLV